MKTKDTPDGVNMREHQAFLLAFAEAEGKPGKIRWALHEVLRRARASAAYVHLFKKAAPAATTTTEPSLEQVVTDLESGAVSNEAPNTESESESSEPQPKEGTQMPKSTAKTDNKTAKKPDAKKAAAPAPAAKKAAPAADTSKKAAKSASVPDLKGARPTGISVDGVSSEVKSWRNVFTSLVEQAIAAKKKAAIPENWFRAEANTQTTVTLKGGQFLYANFTGGQFIPLIQKACEILEVKLVITYVKKGSDKALTLNVG